MATDPVASTLPPGYAVEPPTVATLKSTDVPATHELGPNGIAAKSTLPEGYSVEGQQPPAPTLTPEQTLSRTNANMAAAMSGQQMPNPEDQQGFDEGKKAGTIQGGVDIAAGAVLGPIAGRTAEMLRPTVVAKTIGTGLLDAGGREITRQVVEHGPSELAQSLQKILPSKTTVEQLEKIGRILYHLGAPTAAATYLLRELFGGK